MTVFVYTYACIFNFINGLVFRNCPHETILKKKYKRIKNQMWGFLCRVKFFNGNHWQGASPLQPQWRSFWLRSFRLSRHDRIRASESHGCHGSKCQTPRIHQWIRWNISCYIINIGNLWPFTMSKSESLFGDSQLQHLQAPQLARPSVETGDRYRIDLTCKKSYLLLQNIYSSC